MTVFSKKRFGFVRNLIILNEVLFIPNPETINILEKLGLFRTINDEFKNNNIKKFLKKYNNFMLNPSTYKKRFRVKERIRFYLFSESIAGDVDLQKKAITIVRKHFIDLEENNDHTSYKNTKPIDHGPAQDPSENPWLGILPDDEAETAYWNTK